MLPANPQTPSNVVPASDPAEATRSLIDNSASFHLEAPLAPSTDAFTGLHEKARREQETGFTDYAGAMFRQDSPIDGIAAWAVGHRFEPDNRFNPFDKATFEELSSGVSPEYHDELLKTTSMAQAIFTRDRLLQKQADLTILSDLGVPGNIGRIAMGFVDPANLALGVGSGGLVTLARGGASLSRARGMYRAAEKTGDAALAARGAAMAEKVAKAESGVKGAVTGLSGAAVGGYAFEKVRQSVNFEDSDLDAVIAGLVGTAFASPFVYASSRSMRNAQKAALADLKSFTILKDVQETGRDLTPEERAHFAFNEPADAPSPKSKRTAEEDAAYAQREAAIMADIDKAWSDAPPGGDSPMLNARGMVERDAGNRLRRHSATVRKGIEESRVEARAQVKARVQRALADAPEAGPLRDAFDRALAKQAKAEVMALDPVTSEIRSLIHRPLPEPGAELPEVGTTPKGGVTDRRRFDRPGRGEPEAATPDVQETPASTERGQAPEVNTPAPARSIVGEATSFTRGNNFEDGTIVGVREDGKLMIEDLDGKVHIVSPSNIEPFAAGSPNWEPPSGFLPGSIGSAQVAHLVDDVPRAAMNKTVTVKGVGLGARYDIAASINRSPNKTVRSLGQMLVKEAISTSDFYAQSASASELKRRIQRTLGGAFHLEAGNAFQMASKKMGWKWWEQGAKANVFYADVTRLLTNDVTILDAPRNAAIKGELEAAVSAMRKTMRVALEEAKKAGVQGAENVDENIHYANRVWRPDLISALISKHGKPAVVELLDGARKAAGHTGDVKGTERFLDAIMRLEHSPLSADILLQARDMGTLRRELDNAGLRPEEIDAIVDTLFEVKKTEGDAGNAPNLKYRFQIDEAYSMEIGGETITPRSLMENDARILVDRYLNSMGGNIAMAQKGVKSRAEWEALLKKADDEHAADVGNPDRAGYAGERQLLVDMHAYVSGRPMSVQTFSKVDRVASAMRGYARSVYLGQLGFTAALELTNAAAHSTWTAAIMQMPSFKEYWKAMRAGYVPEGTLADDLRTMTGFSTEHASSYARQSEITDFTYDRKLTNLENMANKASHAVDKFSGNNFLTSYTRGLSSAFTAQKYVNLANGKLELTPAMRRRMVGAGVDDDAIETVLARLKEHADVDSRGRLEHIRYEEWSAKDPYSYHQFLTALDRDVRASIQDHDIGETWFMQHTALGKFFTELRAFAIAAHAKQTLSTLHYRDAQALNLWVTSFATQALGYMVQTSANFSHNGEELEKRLSADRIVKAAVARMSVAGILPVVMNSFVLKPLGADLSGNGLSANTENRDLFSTPSTLLVGRALSTLQAGGQSMFAGENFTGKDVRNALGILPGSNLWGARNIVDWMSSMAPKSELPQQQ